MQVVKCPHYSAELFISSSRAPVCGKCGAPQKRTFRVAHLLIDLGRQILSRQMSYVDCRF